MNVPTATPNGGNSSATPKPGLIDTNPTLVPGGGLDLDNPTNQPTNVPNPGLGGDTTTTTAPKPGLSGWDL